MEIKVIMHYPKDQESIENLKKKVAVIHANAVIKSIEKLSCPKSQKMELVNSLLNKGLQR